MRDSRYRKDRRVGLDAELFYFFINFRDLLFEQLDLAYEMFYLDLFRNGGDANGILCSELKLDVYKRQGVGRTIPYTFKRKKRGGWKMEK